MSMEVSYTPRMVTMALQALARNHGDVDLTARDLINDEFQVPAATLIDWMTDSHAEQYTRIAESLGAEIERSIIRQAQDNMHRAGQLQTDLLERVGRVQREELLSQALRAVTDARSKSTNTLLLLTGRSITGNDGGATVEAMTRLVNSLQGLGLVKVAPSIAATLGDGDVEEITDAGADRR